MAGDLDLTQFLRSVALGTDGARERLWSAVYDQLHTIASSQMSGERAGHTLSPTALVNEAYVKLVRTAGDGSWENRRHFFRAAARAMRQILVDHARARTRQKRGGGSTPLQLAWEPPAGSEDLTDVVALDDALASLEEQAPRSAEVVSLRYFAGLQVAETAEILGVSRRTVINDWNFARAWLHRALSG